VNPRLTSAQARIPQFNERLTGGLRAESPCGTSRRSMPAWALWLNCSVLVSARGVRTPCATRGRAGLAKSNRAPSHARQTCQSEGCQIALDA